VPELSCKASDDLYRTAEARDPHFYAGPLAPFDQKTQTVQRGAREVNAGINIMGLPQNTSLPSQPTVLAKTGVVLYSNAGGSRDWHHALL
jgi:hypothetical protein